MSFSRTMLKSKIHRAKVTDRNIHYEGSVTIDKDLLEAADILEGELVHILNINNGARFETYVFVGEAGSGQVCVNGAAARLVERGDLVIIISYAQVPNEQVLSWQSRVLLVDDGNRIVEPKRS